jgi:hypothetical protein
MEEEFALYERRYVWQPVVRWYHWFNVVCMGVLAITGYYIGTPFVNVAGFPNPYVTGIVRFTHFVTATILALILIVRLYWAFVGTATRGGGGSCRLAKSEPGTCGSSSSTIRSWPRTGPATWATIRSPAFPTRFSGC